MKIIYMGMTEAAFKTCTELTALTFNGTFPQGLYVRADMSVSVAPDFFQNFSWQPLPASEMLGEFPTHLTLFIYIHSEREGALTTCLAWDWRKTERTKNTNIS